MASETEAARKKRLLAEEEARQKIQTSNDVMSLMRKVDKGLGSKEIALEVKKPEDFLSTGLLSLDLIMGGGYYGGQVFQYFGRAHCGKSSLGYTSAGWATTVADIPVAFMDHEGTTDKAYTIKLGMDYDRVLYERPETGEWTYDWIDDFCSKLPDCHSGKAKAIVFIDTVKTMKPQKWIDNPKDKMPAQQASMHHRGWARIATLLTNKHVAIVAANQVTSNVGNPYGAAEVVPGGNAWEFATTNLVRVGRDGTNIEFPDGRVYQPVKFKTYKNKNFIPMQECKVHLELGEGFAIESDVIEFCKLAGYYDKRDRTKSGKPKGPPLLRGLDKYVSGVDQQFKSADAMEAEIRAQGRGGPIFQACRKALLSGEAIERYRASKKRDETENEDIALLDVKREKKTALDSTADSEQDSLPAESDGSATKQAEERTTPRRRVKKAAKRA